MEGFGMIWVWFWGWFGEAKVVISLRTPMSMWTEISSGCSLSRGLERDSFRFSAPLSSIFVARCGWITNLAFGGLSLGCLLEKNFDLRTVLEKSSFYFLFYFRSITNLALLERNIVSITDLTCGGIGLRCFLERYTGNCLKTFFLRCTFCLCGLGSVLEAA